MAREDCVVAAEILAWTLEEIPAVPPRKESHRSSDAAETALTETTRKFGEDDTLRQLQAQIAAGRLHK